MDQKEIKIDWNKIDTVLLDIDGVLIDKHHDDFFFQVMLPETYAKDHGISVEKARDQLKEKYNKQLGSMNWGNIDFWEKELDMNLWDLKYEVRDLAQLHPHTVRFLQFLKKSGKKVYLVSAADPKDIDFKIGDKNISQYFVGIYSQVTLGFAKESKEFWKEIERLTGCDKSRTLLAEDNEKILKTAEQSGIKWLIFKTKNSSTKPAKLSSNFINVHHFDDIIP